MWGYRKMPGKIHSVTEDLVVFPELLNMDLTDMDAFMKVAGMGKGYGIKKWLEQHASHDCRYVIIDDVPDFLPEQQAHVVCPDSRVGITLEDAEKAIAMLR